MLQMSVAQSQSLYKHNKHYTLATPWQPLRHYCAVFSSANDNTHTHKCTVQFDDFYNSSLKLTSAASVCVLVRFNNSRNYILCAGNILLVLFILCINQAIINPFKSESCRIIISMRAHGLCQLESQRSCSVIFLHISLLSAIITNTDSLNAQKTQISLQLSAFRHELRLFHSTFQM